MAKKTRTRWQFEHVCPYCRASYEAINGEDIPGVSLLQPGSPAAQVVAALGTEEIVFEQICTECQKETGGRYAVKIKAWNRPQHQGGGYVLSRANTEKRY